MDPVPLAHSDLPPAPASKSPRWVRLGLALVIGIYLGYSSFGIAAPFLWGHHGYHGATYIQRARMSLRFHMVTPANWSGYEPPPSSAYYFHHPIGYHHLLTLFIPLLGDREWVARGLAAASGLLPLWALFALVRRWWSPQAALLATAVYVGMPILCSFSILCDPMLPAMACSLVTVDLFLCYLAQPTRRKLLLACAAIVAGGLIMWEAYFQAFFHGAFALCWSFTRRGKDARLGTWSAGRAWFFLTGACASLTMAFHFIYTCAVGMLGDFAQSFGARHSTSFGYAISQHRLWLEVNYGWPMVGLGVLWLVLLAVRVRTGRARPRDQAVLIFFLINTLYILLFTEGSSVHLYRVFFYSSFLTLAIVDLFCDLHGFVSRRGAAAVTPLLVLLYFAVETPHAYHNLIESREMMGTHTLPHYNAEYEKQLFAMEVARRTGPDDYYVTLNLPKRIEFDYYLDRSHGVIGSLTQVGTVLKAHPRLVVLMDFHTAAVSEQQLTIEQLKRHPGSFFGPYLLLDLRADRMEIHEYRFVPVRPTWGWRWFVSHKYPPMRVEEQGPTGAK